MVSVETNALRRAALQRANDVRSHRARLRQLARQMSAEEGRVLVAAAIASNPPWLRSMSAWDAVRYAPGVGDRRMREILRAADVRSPRRLQDLTTRQRRLIARQLAGDGFTPVNRAAPTVAASERRSCVVCGARLLDPRLPCGLCELDRGML